MKVHLAYPDRDLELPRALLPNEKTLTQDLELNTLFGAMANGDDFLLQTAKQVVLSSLQDDIRHIVYRQAVLKDCTRNFSIVGQIYDIAVDAIESRRRQWLGMFSTTYPSSTLHSAVTLLKLYAEKLGALRLIADQHYDKFESEGFRTFFTMLKAELADDYFATVKDHLERLQLKEGMLMSAALGNGNQGTGYVLCRPPGKRPGWIKRLLTRGPPGRTFYLGERDEAGARALSELQNRGVNLVANALAQSADHILGFFSMLRTEVAFYIGSVNLHEELTRRGVPTCYPVPTPAGTPVHVCAGLTDACLALSTERRVVGNSVDTKEKKLVLITGANQGGKSTFLRSIGVAQLMMQSGMFVAAESFSANLCRGLFTHYKREEDAAMNSGKFDEELGRMSAIVDMLKPDSLVLFNESFAATNEREGSEVARQIVRALIEKRVTVFFVTHLYDLAHGFCQDEKADAYFVRAERESDGQRSFRLIPGEPLSTSFGVDLYEQVFRDTPHGSPVPEQSPSPDVATQRDG
jgi:hypothetical protein